LLTLPIRLLGQKNRKNLDRKSKVDNEDNDWKNKFAGRLIALDGPDGVGKTTQVRLLIRGLQMQKVPASGFRDPGDTLIGEKIRQILLSPEHIAMSTRTEVLLYMAARAQLWQEKIVPLLRAKECVVLDRWVSSTCAYQGHAGGFGMHNVIKIATDCLARFWPDLTIILDADPQTCTSRMSRKLDRIEAKPQEYHQRVREGFLVLAREQRNFFVIDASADVGTVHQEIMQVVSEAKFT
jgi:dTMP kinase